MNLLRLCCLLLCALFFGGQGVAQESALPARAVPVPLLAADHPVGWWFVFKFNVANFPGCPDGTQSCPFDKPDIKTKSYTAGSSQQFVYASSEGDTLQKGIDCLGDSVTDPLGATFDEVYNGSYFYVIWNDQFKGDPSTPGCTGDCSSPWGHSKGLLAWNKDGEGFVMQVTTPSWPASGSSAHPRKKDGNSLGCVLDDNIEYSQHFFALKLSKEDVAAVLDALANASVVTDPNDLQIVNNGGPTDIQSKVASLGVKVSNTHFTLVTLSSGVQLISKPSALHVPPWQLVSAALGDISLRTANWSASPSILSTNAGQTIGCWENDLGPYPGAVDIATTGQWLGVTIGLKAGPNPNGNHAKIGVSTSGDQDLSIFGDLNQQGSLSGNCGSSQDGRGGMFFVLKDKTLSQSIGTLIAGESKPTTITNTAAKKPR